MPQTPTTPLYWFGLIEETPAVRPRVYKVAAVDTGNGRVSFDADAAAVKVVQIARTRGHLRIAPPAVWTVHLREPSEDAYVSIHRVEERVVYEAVAHPDIDETPPGFVDLLNAEAAK